MGSSYLSEFPDSILNDSFNILRTSKDNRKRILALLILKEVAANSPIHFYQHMESFKQLILANLNDKDIHIREAAGKALSACLLLMQQRENQKRNDFYHKFLEPVLSLPNDNRSESIHGFLIAIDSFLKNSMEFSSMYIDPIYPIIRSYFNSKEVYIKKAVIRAMQQNCVKSRLDSGDFPRDETLRDFVSDRRISRRSVQILDGLHSARHLPRRCIESCRRIGDGSPRGRVSSNQRDRGLDQRESRFETVEFDRSSDR